MSSIFRPFHVLLSLTSCRSDQHCWYSNALADTLHSFSIYGISIDQRAFGLLFILSSSYRMLSRCIHNSTMLLGWSELSIFTSSTFSSMFTRSSTHIPNQTKHLQKTGFRCVRATTYRNFLCSRPRPTAVIFVRVLRQFIGRTNHTIRIRTKNRQYPLKLVNPHHRCTHAVCTALILGLWVDCKPIVDQTKRQEFYADHCC